MARTAAPILGFVATAIFSSLAHAQQVETLEPYVDVWRRDVPVGAAFLNGFSAPAPASAASIDSVYLDFSRTYSGDVCLKLQSRDGRYSGKGVFRVAVPQPQRLRIRLPLAKLRNFDRLERDDLTALAAIGSTCDATGGGVVKVLWSDAQTDAANLYVNATAGRAVLHAWTASGKSTGACSPLRGGLSVAYDTRCTVPAAAREGLSELGVMVFDGTASRGGVRVPIR